MKLSALVKLQHLEERISEQDLPLVLDVGQLVDIHSADGGHNAAGELFSGRRPGVLRPAR